MILICDVYTCTQLLQYLHLKETLVEFPLFKFSRLIMAHIKNYLFDSEEELNQAFIKTVVDATPFKIGDYVKISTSNTDEKWIITAFSVTADGEPAALLESDTFNTFSLLQCLRFYYH